jgi:hypothetical protein
VVVTLSNSLDLSPMCKWVQKHGLWDFLAQRDPYRLLTTTSLASKYWGIDQSIRILDKSTGIVDTGTTLIRLANGELIFYST